MVPVCSAVCMGQTLVTARRQWYLSVVLSVWAGTGYCKETVVPVCSALSLGLTTEMSGTDYC